MLTQQTDFDARLIQIILKIVKFILVIITENMNAVITPIGNSVNHGKK